MLLELVQRFIIAEEEITNFISLIVNILMKYRPFFLSITALFLLFFLFKTTDLTFLEQKGVSYVFISIILNISTFIYMLLDNNSESIDLQILGFIKLKIFNIRFIALNIAVYLAIIYFKSELNFFIGVVLLVVNNSVTFLLFNLLKLKAVSKYKNDYILLIGFLHVIIANLLLFDSQIVLDIIRLIPMVSVYFFDESSSFTLLMISGYTAYLMIVLNGYRSFYRERVS